MKTKNKNSGYRPNCITPLEFEDLKILSYCTSMTVVDKANDTCSITCKFFLKNMTVANRKQIPMRSSRTQGKSSKQEGISLWQEESIEKETLFPS